MDFKKEKFFVFFFKKGAEDSPWSYGYLRRILSPWKRVLPNLVSGLTDCS